MKTKTVVATNAREFDEAVSTASKTLGGKFTQTHVGFGVNGQPMHFVAVIFYEDN